MSRRFQVTHISQRGRLSKNNRAFQIHDLSARLTILLTVDSYERQYLIAVSREEQLIRLVSLKKV